MGLDGGASRLSDLRRMREMAEQIADDRERTKMQKRRTQNNALCKRCGKRRDQHMRQTPKAHRSVLCEDGQPFVYMRKTESRVSQSFSRVEVEILMTAKFGAGEAETKLREKIRHMMIKIQEQEGGDG